MEFLDVFITCSLPFFGRAVFSGTAVGKRDRNIRVGETGDRQAEG